MAGLSPTAYKLLRLDIDSCIAERGMHPACSKDAVLAFYSMSWARQFDPDQFIALVTLLERRGTTKAAR